MSVDTKVNLLGHVTVPTLLDFLKDHHPVSDVCHTEHEMLPEAIQSDYKKYDDEKWYADYGFIFFDMPNGQKKCLFYSYSNVNFCNNAGCQYPLELKKIIESETTCLSLGYDEAGIQLMKEIVSYFGGWIDENDSDEEGFYFVPGKRKEDSRKFLSGDIVQHFKRELSSVGQEYLYRVIGPAMHTETQEQLMVYQAMYGEKEIFARPMEDFLSEVDHGKYPFVKQKYRLAN